MTDLHPIVSFVFSPSTSSWVPQATTATKETKKGSIRLATLNVLHDNNPAWREYFLQSPKRNDHMIKLITELEPDVLCLNEVTVNILSKILQNPKIRELYYVSDIPKTTTETENMSIHNKCPFGNILLSKLPFIESYYLQLTVYKISLSLFYIILINYDRNLLAKGK